MMLRLEGILPPMVTPLLEGERVDEEGLARQVERMIAGGVHGIYFLGSTGESPMLREGERRRALKAAVAAVRGRVPLVVGTMASSTAKAIDNIAMAEEAGADAIAVTPPHYYPPSGEAELWAHYEAARQATCLPLVIYNIPGTTKVMLSPELIARLAERDRVIGIKDSSGDWNHALKLLFLLRDHPRFSLLFGSIQVAGPAILYGAEGAVIGPVNLDPRLFVRLYGAARAGKIEEVYALQERALSLARVISFGAPIACIKAALELMGVCGATVAQPFQPVSPEAREKIAAILREHELI
jgi:dihydrodipicolinate synthase/N-acetylneuraminate lyase